MKHFLAGASLLPLLAMGGIAHAADAPAAGPVGEIIVTGTRQTGVKAADSAAPIEIVGAVALKRVGQPDLIQSLEQNLPSFNAEGYGQDAAALVLAANLRGLNPNDTLVLINGKRRHTTSNLHVDPGPYQGAAAADLGLIPIGAIDHIEVLEDGAAAQYGTDAIAGVINIILKNSPSAGSISGTLGQYYEGDGKTGAISINKGFDLGGKGFINLTAEERYHGFSQQGGCDSRFSNPDCSLKSGLSPEDTAGIPLTKGYPYENRIYGDTQSNIYNGFYNAGYNITDGVQFYSFGSFSHRKASAFENYRAPSKVTQNNGETLIVPFPLGFSPREQIVENDYAVTGGLKGAASGWDWDLSTTYGHDKNDISTINTANRSLFQDTGFTPTNIYDGAWTATQWTSNLDLDHPFDVGMASPLNVAFGGEIRKDTYAIAQGDAASIYKEGGQSYPGFQPTDQASHSRTNYAAYVDFAGNPVANLKVDIAGRYEHYSDFGNAYSGKLTARYDFSPAFAIRGTVSTGFRAPTLAEEFYSATNVAPTFATVNLPPNSPAAHQAGFSSLKPEKSDNYSVGFVAHPAEHLQITVDAYEIDIRDRIVNTGTLLGLTTGTVPGLTPGPVPGCLTLPNSTIPIPPTDTVVSCPVLQAIGVHGNVIDPTVSYVGIAVFTNGVNTRTRGIDATANYASDFGDMGHVDWSVGFSYNDNKITKLQPLPLTVTSVPAGQTSIMSPESISYLTTAMPKEKLVLGAYFTHGRFSANLRETVYGPVSVLTAPNGAGTGPNATYTNIGTTGITDLDIGFALTHSLKLDAGANNLFNHKPPFVPTLANGKLADGNNVYKEPIQSSPFGINGGYYYVKATFNF